MTYDAEQIQGVERIATFSAPFNAAVPQGVKAWYVQSVDGSKAKMTAVPDGYAIPAGQGVLLTSSRFIDTFVMEQAPASTPVADLTGNRLHGSADKTYAISSADNAYVLRAHSMAKRRFTVPKWVLTCHNTELSCNGTLP